MMDYIIICSIFHYTSLGKKTQIHVRNWNYLEKDAMEVSSVPTSYHRGALPDRFLRLKRRLSGMRFYAINFVEMFKI